MRILAGIVMALILTGCDGAGPYEDGLAAYERGDYATALRLWRPLAEQGNAGAQHILGLMYDSGQGVPQDLAEAVKWYRLAAEQGYGSAQLNLATMYARGDGVPPDYVQAHMWFNLAASGLPSSIVPKDRDKAVKYRDIIASNMTPAQIAEAQKLAREWKPK